MFFFQKENNNICRYVKNKTSTTRNSAGPYREKLEMRLATISMPGWKVDDLPAIASYWQVQFDSSRIM